VRRETALLRRVAVGGLGNRCARSAHPQAIGTVMVMLQGAYTDFLKGASRPSAQSSSSCVAGACALVGVSWLHQVGRPNLNGFRWTLPPAAAAVFSTGALRARVYFEGTARAPQRLHRNEPVSAVNTLGACCCVGCCRAGVLLA
jgi:hypothetical protein